MNALQDNIANEPQEAYRKGKQVIVVHMHRNGEVYFHKQKWDATYVLFNAFGRMDKAEFYATIEREGAEKFDPAELPCNCLELPVDGWGPL